MFLCMFYIFITLASVAWADDACNNKYKNLVKLVDILKDDPHAKVPPFLSISSERIKNFLESKSNFYLVYHETIKQLATELNFELPKLSWCKSITLYFKKLTKLKEDYFSLDDLVKRVFSRDLLPFTTDEERFFNDARQKNLYLMVRSSGLEDSKTTANAGLYVSVPYVTPNRNYVEDAIQEVVASYFNLQALKNNLIAGLDLYNMPLCIPVLIQQLIGEPFGGAMDFAHIPVSGVAFSTQSGLGTEHFKVTEINAAYGHGEGVVANRVPVDRYYVTESRIDKNKLSIYPMINYKPQRLVPRARGLQLMKNPHDFIAKPCITKEQIEHLYAVLKKIETAYGQPMDVEFVIQNGTIYIVQARPAMHFEQKPSYIPDAALTEAQRNAVVAVNTIVAGSSQVCIVTDAKKLIIKDTLDDADADPQRSTAQAVFVGAWASSLSHAAVNFIGFGIPCFYVQDLNLIKNMVLTISEKRPLVIDTQRQLVYLWDTQQKTVESVLVAGWYEHPIARSLSIINGVTNYRIVRDSPVVPQDAELVQKMLQLKNVLGSTEQKLLFEDIAERIQDRIAVTEKRIAHIDSLCDALCFEIFTAFKAELFAVLRAFKYAIEHGAERFELLFYHKMLEALLYQENDDRAGINRYTYRWFLYDLFIKQSIKGSVHVGDSLTTLLEYAQHCPGKELVDEWRNFIKKLDDCTDKELVAREVNTLNSLLALLEKVDGISLWFATIFYQHMSVLEQTVPEKTIITTLQQLNNDYSAETQEFILFTQSIHDNISTMKAAMQQKLDTVEAVEHFWNEMNHLIIKPLTNEQFIGEFSQASFLGKLLMCKQFSAVVDIIDESIKMIKSSHALSFVGKKIVFKMMLDDFLNLCKRWLTDLMPENALKYHSYWPLRSYLKWLTDFSRTVFRDSASVSEEHYFQKSADFSVQAAILGSHTAFERHFPETPEDLFMLIHQNSLVAVSAIYKSLFAKLPLSDVIYMPAAFKDIFEYVETESAVEKAFIGFSYDETKIVMFYNMPLRNHSATFQISYSFITQEIKLHAQYLGEARARWEQIAVAVAVSPELSGLVLDDLIIFDKSGGFVGWTWKCEDIEVAKIIFAYLDLMNNLSFEHDISRISFRSVNKTTESTWDIFRKVYPQFATRIKGSLEQNWQK